MYQQVFIYFTLLTIFSINFQINTNINIKDITVPNQIILHLLASSTILPFVDFKRIILFKHSISSIIFIDFM